MKKSQKKNKGRVQEHFEINPPPDDIISALEGICIDIEPKILYNSSLNNLIKKIYISDHGSIVYINPSGRDTISKKTEPLNFAFYIASIWIKQFKKTGAKMIGFKERVVFKKISPDKAYIIKIMPAKSGSVYIHFDIWIYDKNGSPIETIEGLRMKKIRYNKNNLDQLNTKSYETITLKKLQKQCDSLSVLELKTITEFAHNSLSKPEKSRYKKLGNKRKISYLAGRLSCKYLSRKLSGNDLKTPSQSITTIKKNSNVPVCPVKQGKKIISCSVSHNSRFAIAVSSDKKIGIDVEEISQSLINTQKFYIKASELPSVKNSSLGEVQASIRIWTIKEAVSKALNINLTKAWEKTEIINIGQQKSRVIIDNKTAYAYHETVGSHVFTLIVIL